MKLRVQFVVRMICFILGICACVVSEARSYEHRRRKAKGLLGGALGGAFLGGLIGGGKGAGYGALAGGIIGLIAASEADKRARYYESYRPTVYPYGTVDTHQIYYFIDQDGYPVYFYYDTMGRRIFVELRNN